MSERILSEEEALLEAQDEMGEETAVSSDASDTPEPTLEEQLDAARAEAAKNLDGWMRTQAEFSNARKRMEKQRLEIQQRATGDMAARLLPVMDDFDRAMDNVPETISADSWFEGIQLVQRKLAMILEGLNVQPITAVGQPFDPNLHEAIMQEASDEYDSGVVTRELQKGYTLGDRVIRPALVYVAE